MSKGITKSDYAKVVEALGAKPTCLFVSVEAEVPNTDPLNERESQPGLRVVHVHTDDYEGPCLPSTGHVPGVRTHEVEPD